MRRVSKTCEYGKNENGEYWKYPNGLMICRKQYLTNMLKFSQMNSLFKSNSITWTFPYSFVDLPSISYSFVPYGIGWIGSNDISGVLFIFNIIQNENVESKSTIGFTAIGRWK